MHRILINPSDTGSDVGGGGGRDGADAGGRIGNTDVGTGARHDNQCGGRDVKQAREEL